MSIGKKTAIATFLALSITATLLPASLAFADTNAGTNLIANGSFETTREYDFPTGWHSDGEDLIPNGDFESRDYWLYNNGNLYYEYDPTINSTTGKIEWNAQNKWNAITMRTDKQGLYWENNKRYATAIFGGIPVAWGESYIPRMKVKYTGDLNDAKNILMQMNFGSAVNMTTLSDGRALDIIAVRASNIPKDTWTDLGGSVYTIPAASSVVSSYNDQTPGAIKLINVARGESKADADISTVFAWADDARFEKISRTSTDAASAGSKSLKVRGYADGVSEEWRSDPVSVISGETVEVKSKVRVDEISSYTRGSDTVLPEVAVSAVFDNGTVSKVGSVTAVTDGFVEISGNVTVPAAGKVQLVYTFDGKGTAYFDDAQIISFNRILNGGFECADSNGFPVSWDSNGKNIAKNGDFESNSLSVGYNLTGTKQRSYSNVGNTSGIELVSNINAPAELGNYSLKMTWNKADVWGGVGAQDDAEGLIPLAYGKDYIMRAAVKAGRNTDFPAAANHFQFCVISNYAGEGGTVDKNTTSTVLIEDNSWIPTTKWQEFTGTYTVPSKPAGAPDGIPFATRYQLRARTSAAADAVLYVDNFSFEKLGRADTTEKQSGSKSLKIVAYDDGIDEVWTSGKITVTENERLDISAVYKTASLAGGLNISAKFYNGSAYLSEQALASSVTDTSWTDVSETVSVPEGANGMEIVFNVPGASGSAWIDNVSVTTAESEPEPQEEYTPVTDGNIYTSEDVDGEQGFVASYEPEEASGTKEVEWKIIDFHDMKFTTRTQTISLDKAKEGIVKFGLILKDTVAGHDYSAMYFLR